jgi:hypothetical protein
MRWFHYFLRAPAAGVLLAAGNGQADVTFKTESDRCDQYGPTPRQHLFPGACAVPPWRRSGGRRSTMSLHVLRDIGVTPTMAQFKGLSVDWRP